MQTIRPATTLHGTAGVLIDDDNFAIFNDVVNVTRKQHVCAQCRGNVMHQHNVSRRVQRLAFFHDARFNQHLFNQDQTTFGQVNLTAFLINGEVTFALEGIRVFFFLTDQLRNKLVHADVHLGAVFCRTRDDQRRTRFIDQNGVNLIHQRIVQFALNTFFRAKRHVVAQVVKTVFVVSTVGDIGGVSGAFCRCSHTRQVDAHRQAEEFEQWTVVFGVTLGQVVVHGNNVHAFAAQRIQISRQGCGQGFTFTSTHFCDTAVIQNHTA